MINSIQFELEHAKKCLDTFLANEHNIEQVTYAADLMVGALKSNKKILACGNGGSMTDAMHFAEELSGRFRADRPPLAALAIADPAYLSCVANDYGYEHVFSRMVHAIGQKGDVLLAISTSGNSNNVLLAAQKALDLGMTVIALTGKDGGALAQLAKVEIRAPNAPFADRAQEIHIKVIHAMINYIEHQIFRPQP